MADESAKMADESAKTADFFLHIFYKIVLVKILGII